MTDCQTDSTDGESFRSMTQGVARFRGQIFPQQRALYHQLARDGQKPKALMISCADSRVIPEMITQSRPGELFVCRNAGNIVPPFEHMNGGVSSAIEYAVVALGVHDIVVCGHSECGAMSALLHPEKLSAMPNVAAWLRHSRAAEQIVTRTCPVDASDSQRHQALAMENVLVQVNHLRTHPAVAAALATRSVALHGWFFDLQHGAVLAYDGRAECFIPLAENSTPPVAVPPRGADAAPRLAAE